MVKLRAFLRAGALSLGLLTAAGSLAALAAAESGLSEEQFGSMVRAYLLKHPEVLREVIDALDKKEKSALMKGEGDRKAKVAVAFAVGKNLAEAGKKAGVEAAVFDRNGFAYTGRIAALADGAREGGLKF